MKRVWIVGIFTAIHIPEQIKTNTFLINNPAASWRGIEEKRQPTSQLRPSCGELNLDPEALRVRDQFD